MAVDRAASSAALPHLVDRLQAYKRRFYQNRLLKGVLLTIGLLLGAYLLVAALEGLGHFGPTVREGLFYVAVGVSAAVLGYYFAWPTWQLLQARRLMSDDEAARQLGTYFPEVQDRLLNLLQLSREASASESALLVAAMEQKTRQLAVVPFAKAIDLSQNRRYVAWAALPMALLLLILLFVPQFLTESTTRLLQYKKEFLPVAPFAFRLENDTLTIVKGEPLTLRLTMTGKALPEDVSVQLGSTTLPMEAIGNGRFQYKLGAIDRSQSFRFTSGGFYSESYKLSVLVPPAFEAFTIKLTPPAYTGRMPEVLDGQGNFSVPEGTKVEWNIRSTLAEAAVLAPDSTKPFPLLHVDEAFVLKKALTKSMSYTLALQAPQVPLVTAGPYLADVIADLYPRAELQARPDSVDQDLVYIAGALSDDYGLTRLELVYRVASSEAGLAKASPRTRALPLPGRSKAETFLLPIRLSDLGVQAGQSVELAVRVLDNDGVHGPKGTVSGAVRFASSTKAEEAANQSQRASETMKQLQNNEERSKQLEKDLKATRDRLVGKKQMTFQDKQALEKLAQQQQSLQKDLEQLKQQAEQLSKDQQKLNPTQAQEIKEKSELLQKLLEDLLDEETKKMYEELQKLLDEKTNSDEARDLLEKLQGKEKNLTKELDRALELFKQLTVEKKIDEAANRLEDLAKEQQKLANEMKEAKSPSADQKQELAQKQEKLNQEFDQVKEDLKALEELNKELESPEKMPDTKADQQKTDAAQDEAKDKAQKGKSKEASKKAEEAADSMEKMAKEMKESQDAGDEEQSEENAEDLRKILENLLKLSFSQEQVMNEMRQVNQLDPKYLALGQEQLKLKDDAVLVEDSLYALAKRVFQIQTFVTREVTDMKGYIDEAVDAVKRRRQDLASGKGQLAMTSMNNLALMLSEALNQMQQEMKQQQKSGSGKGKPKKGKPKPGEGKKPSLSQMQKRLGEQLKQLQKSGKTGRGLSEEVAKMAAQQEAIRRALQELEKAGGKEGKDQKGEGGSENGGLKQAMEQQEKDLVNKRVTEQMVRRQQEIETLLLEAEKALREREQDTKRESKTATALPNRPPADLRAYLKAKQTQTELLKTQTLNVIPFFKRENERYFKTLQGRAKPKG
jgi:hypothetical protein